MDEVVSKLEKLTNEFVKQLDTTDIDALVKFVEDRQVLIDEFAKLREQDATADSPNIASRLKHILSYDSLINEKMKHLMDTSMHRLTKLNQTKKREQAYNPAYSPDSLYFDKKK